MISDGLERMQEARVKCVTCWRCFRRYSFGRNRFPVFFIIVSKINDTVWVRLATCMQRRPKKQQMKTETK